MNNSSIGPMGHTIHMSKVKLTHDIHHGWGDSSSLSMDTLDPWPAGSILVLGQIDGNYLTEVCFEDGSGVMIQPETLQEILAHSEKLEWDSTWERPKRTKNAACVVPLDKKRPKRSVTRGPTLAGNAGCADGPEEEF